MMGATILAIHKVGLITAVGSTAPASCAAFRAKVNNPSPTRFMDATGEWVLGHAVNLPDTLRGLPRLVSMARIAMDEALAGVPDDERAAMPLLLCVAEKERPGRQEGLNGPLMDMIQAESGVRFSADSSVIAQGRVGVAVALAMSRKMLEAGRATRVLIVATDSLLIWPTVSQLDSAGRLLTSENSNGFMVGEGAGALLVGRPTHAPQLLCTGLGFAMEPAHFYSDEPLRADGLSAAIKDATKEARLAVGDFDYRIADLSGEQYYFKEAALALQRTLHQPKAEFDVWHPAECTGEAGALAGAAIIALADAAARKGYAKGPNVMAHLSNDAGPRAALALQYRSA